MNQNPSDVEDRSAAFAANLRAGLRVCLFRRVRLDAFRLSSDQLAALLSLELLMVLVADYLVYGPAAAFNEFALPAHAFQVMMVLTAAYLVARMTAGRVDPLGAAVLVMSTAPPLILIAALAEAAAGSDSGNPWMLSLPLVWGLAVDAYLMYLLSGARAGLAVRLFIVFVPVTMLPLWIGDYEPFWYPEADAASEREMAAMQVNPERTYYDQERLLNATRNVLLPERPGVPDLYFVGFAGWAGQGVFASEVRYARGLFDRRFDTAGRSLVLINSPQTVERLPLGSGTNLRLMLRHLGTVMDTEEDVLFLFLTSHGAPGRLGVHFGRLGLNDLRPADVRAWLDAAGIKWRILVVSACYSGGFARDLIDENTLLITAAAADRQSNGCRDGNAFTHFGKALLVDGLARGGSFLDSFRLAIDAVAAREAQERLEPSHPQLLIGGAVVEALTRVEARLGLESGNEQAWLGSETPGQRQSPGLAGRGSTVAR